MYRRWLTSIILILSLSFSFGQITLFEKELIENKLKTVIISEFTGQSIDTVYNSFSNDLGIYNLNFLNSVSFQHCSFNCLADFKYSIFQAPVSFDDIDLKKGLDFTGATLYDNLQINECKNLVPLNFGKDFNTDRRYSQLSSVTITNSNFNPVFQGIKAEDISFRDCGLKDFKITRTDSVDFFDLSTCTLTGSTEISNSTFRDFSVSDSKIMDTIIFSQNSIKNLHFINDTIFGLIKLSGADFKKLNFYGTTIKKYLNLSNLDLRENSSINFSKAILPDTIDLSFNNKIPNEIDLTVANYEDSGRYDANFFKYKKHLINLFKTDVSKIKMDYRFFKLVFYNSNTQKELIDDDKEGLYESLLKTFKDRGLNESYKLLDIEFRDYKWKNAGFPFISFLNKIWWNYGYNKEYVFIWTFGLITLFTLINFFTLRYLQQEVYKVENIAVPSKKKIFLRMWYSFIYSSAIFFKLTLKLDNINFHRKRGSMYLIIMYSLGLLCLAYIANYIIQK